MARLRPLVIETSDMELEEFVQYVMDQHASSTTLVVCSTKDDIVASLLAATFKGSEQLHAHDGETTGSDVSLLTSTATQASPSTHRWAIPTLRLLATSRTVKVIFCSDVTHLRAYLAAYPYRMRQPSTEDAEVQTSRLLAILNPINLHRLTSAFSAQGLNRTFSTAVEAAHHTSSRLVMAECTMENTAPVSEYLPGYENGSRLETAPALASPWDEEVSILNVTTKTFGAGERGWVGRTVKVRTIAGRWCAFESLERAMEA